VESNKQYTRVMADCSGCKVTQVEWLITDALDPVKTDAIIGAALAANPDANYLVLPYSIGLPSVVDAVRKAGKTDKVKIVAKDGDSVGLSAIASGGSSMNAGVSLQWVAYAGVDQIIRGLAKEPYLKAEELGLGVHLFTKADSPADGNADYTKFLDYVSEYKKLWGLS
jgi:ABC-type sugar transport system substrate-binding protein